MENKKDPRRGGSASAALVPPYQAVIKRDGKMASNNDDAAGSRLDICQLKFREVKREMSDET